MYPQSFRRSLSRALHCAAGAGLMALSFQAAPEDIDIFAVDESNTLDKPNILIVLDNSANWSRQAQQWPGGLTQGQGEVEAIKNVINSLDDGVLNVGMMEYITGAAAGDREYGYLRYHIRPMNAANKADFAGHLDTIYNNINDPIEKRDQNNAFGGLMWDVYNYLGGLNTANAGIGTPASRADAAAYTNQYTQFRSPLADAENCRRTIVIVIANNRNGALRTDDAAVINALSAAGGDTTELPFAEFVVTTGTATVDRGYSDTCYVSDADCTAAENNQDCLDNGFTSCSCDAADFLACPKEKYTAKGVESQLAFDYTTVTMNPGVYTNEATIECKRPNQLPSYSCPPDLSETLFGVPAANQRTDRLTSWANCAYVSVGDTGCTGGKRNWEPRGDQTVTDDVYTDATTVTDLGLTTSCSVDPASCDLSGFADCPQGGGSVYDSCFCDTPTDGTGCPAAGSMRFQVLGESITSSAEATGTFTNGVAGVAADEWAKFLRQTGVPIPGSATGANAQVTTYTIDVFNAQQSAEFSALMFSMARVGGGKYYQARDNSEIQAALEAIFAEVQAVNSAFSSASLPVNATNRAQNENQVFIGVFRPERAKKPRWFGNLKRYQLIDVSGATDLGDAEGKQAINLLTGFIDPCAVSFWTSESGDYWSDAITDDPDAATECNTGVTDPHSDYPDGPFVEKGAAAQIQRRGNVADGSETPSSTNMFSGDGVNENFDENRDVITVTGAAPGGAIATFDTATAPTLTARQVAFMRGVDVGDNPFDEDQDGNFDGTTFGGAMETRASIHGDVVHSRPQPVNYGGGTGVVVYYGANDGTYRAVRASDGVELWALFAPEHEPKVRRYFLNDPIVFFHGSASPTAQRKDYFFDGSTGLFQNADNSKVYIFPTMRRGGRMVYGLDVTDPSARPTLKWRQGCDDSGSCTAGFAGIGQTWSLPNVAFVKEFKRGNLSGGAEDPLIFMGGGYDACEDQDTASPGGCTLGSGVYVINAETGDLVRHFSFGGRSIAADVALLDRDGDGRVDFAYAASTGGDIYRMDLFEDPADTSANLTDGINDPAFWNWTRVAYTNGAGRKFLFTPSLFQNGDTVYLGIGSGDREAPLQSQYANAVQNKFYVFKDDLTDSSFAPTTTIDLDDPNVVDDRTVDAGCAATEILPGSSVEGWAIDLAAGEQVVTASLIVGGQVLVSTNQPDPSAATSCSNNLGVARGYIMNLLTGAGAVGTDGLCGGDRSSEFVGGGLPPTPVLAQVPITLPDGTVQIRTVVIGGAQKDGSVSTIIGAQRYRPPIDSVRRPIYWRRAGDSD